jgi:tetratricopeptide (TPR) repeat protein
MLRQQLADGMKSQLRMRILLLTVVGLVSASVALWVFWPQQTAAEKLATAARLIDTDPQTALQLSEEVLAADSTAVLALQIAGDAAAALQDQQKELFYLGLLADARPDDFRLQMRLVHALLDVGALIAAEERLKLIADMSHEAQRELATLFLSEGRQVEAKPLLFRLVVGRQFTLDDLIFLGTDAELLEDRETMVRATKRQAPPAVAFLGLATLADFEFRNDDAQQLFEQALELDAECAPAWAGLGRVLLRSDASAARLQQWASAVPESAQQHPEVLFNRARVEHRAGNAAAAIRLLTQTVQQAPNHLAACQLLGNLLAQSGQDAAAERILHRAGRLDETERLLHRILNGERTPELMKQAAGLMEQLERPTEAWAWWLSTASLFQTETEAGRRARVLESDALAAQHAVSVATVTELLQGIDVESLVQPDLTRSVAGNAPAASPQTTTIRMTDISEAVGLRTPYYGGFEGEPRGVWIYQGFGGGVAVGDFDGDGQPDLYFVHGNTWPPRPAEPRARNLLYLQRAGAMVDASRASLTDDSGFGQGVAAADFNQDGFVDLLVANIGPNQLLLNNGDGTFQTVPLKSFRESSNWTTSVAMADLDGDGLTDIYEANYVSGSYVFEHRCTTDLPGQYRSCKPDLFPAATDRILLNDGEGGLRDLTGTEGVASSVGRGLGVLVADLDDNGRLDVFVANDMTANSLLLNESGEQPAASTSAHSLRLTDQAVLRGVAVNGAGRVEACMGIASADFNRDEKLDLFVTNFYDETNTLYVQQMNGFFVDLTARTRVADISRKVLGFGAQAVDLDNDADAELVVLNGHVDDFSHLQMPWRMVPHVYHNTGEGQFSLLPEAALTEYGAQPQLGRALARLDWDSDGRMDVVATHLDRHPALLVNETTGSGRWLRLRLVGRRSSRDAIGASVRVSTGDRSFTVHVMAGDGYYCSNERVVHLGLGDVKQVSRISVTWPAGTKQSWNDVNTNAVYTAIEGRDQLYKTIDE